MNLVSIIILLIIIVAAIFLLTYVAHDRGSSMCAGCHGDCANCASKKKEEDQSEKQEEN